ncbi:MAG: rpsU-divergently transcribed protein [Phenylobacterium zucineum]|nr:MAG: rpsU-divergently transcribed protein [Phenylobacterium zucineum]
MTDWASKTEQEILHQALNLAPGQGWTRPMVLACGTACGLSGPETELLLPHGPSDLAALMSRRHDALALKTLPDPASLKIRERIRAAVLARIEVAALDGPAVRRWAGWLALPTHLPLAFSLVWESADKIWRWAGDTATDENHYSKRAILAGILISAVSLRFSAGAQATERFVEDRIENVMTFEKWKAGIRPSDLTAKLATSLGRLRYGRG